MIRALYSAASGMNAQQLNVDNIANNLANANTAGYKTRRAQFQDLLDASWASAQSPRDLRRVGSTFHQASHHPFNWAQSYLFGHSFTSDAFRLLSRYTGTFVRV